MEQTIITYMSIAPTLCHFSLFPDDAPLADPPAPIAPQHQFPELDPVIVGLQMPGTGIRTVPSVEVTSEAPPTSWLTEIFLLASTRIVVTHFAGAQTDKPL